MRVIINTSNDPYFNLALEEYLLKESDDEIFMLWQNRSSVIVGKNQNTASEVDITKARERGVDIVRRETGGGAVYHDMGNLNYSFISNDPEGFMDFKRFASPIFKTLNQLGIKAELSGRNDFAADGRKFSGNAQSIYRNRLLHHGTILFDSDIEALTEFLTVDETKITSKGISSVKSRVINISSLLKKKIDIEDFKNMILNNVLCSEEGELSSLTAEEIKLADNLKKQKYDTWEWNFGYAPPYTFHNQIHTAAGIIEVFLNVENGIITNAKIYGDFFSKENISEFEKKIAGTRHINDDIRGLILNMNTENFFGTIAPEELLRAFF